MKILTIPVNGCKIIAVCSNAAKHFEREKGYIMEECLFCKIIDGEIPSKKVYEDEKILAFMDINPQAPVHFLVIPKQHICCADKINEENCEIVAYIFTKIPQIAKKLGLSNGYRIVNNCGDDACQTVKHMHFHILGGRQLKSEMA